MDWSHILISRASSGSFAGRTAADEDAYFAFFGSDEIAPVKQSSDVLGWWKSVVLNFQALRLPRRQRV